MGFKDDWSFLDKITMGAVGTEKVIQLLNNEGHNIIELERYCTSNKIWATKIKRLRIPDLLCLKCGKRIESRAKSKLGIIMSDAVSNPDRRWYVGLRDEDLIAFVQCHRDESNNWVADDVVNLFSTDSLKKTEDKTKLSAPKSVNEGAERDRTWPCYVPGFDFTVSAIELEDENKRIRLIKRDGNRQSKKISMNDYIYVKVGDTYPAGSKIASSIVCDETSHECSEQPYDFIKDLESDTKETVYTAVKALGYLPSSKLGIQKLTEIISNTYIDKRIKLEAFSSLLRLGINEWEAFIAFAEETEEKEIKMEFILILGELNHYAQAIRILQNISNNISFSDELRAAAIWSMNSDLDTLESIVDFCFDKSAIIANHAISKIEKNFSSELTTSIIRKMDNNIMASAVCARILSSSQFVNKEAVVHAYLNANKISVKDWLLFAIGLSDKQGYEQLILLNDPNAELTLNKLHLLWDNQTNYLTKEEIENINFIKQQK